VDEVSNNLNASYILLAVSKSDLTTTSLSSANWQFESTSTTYSLNGTTTWADQPLVSVDGHNIYVSTNQFSASSSYQGSVLSVFDYGLSKVGDLIINAIPSYQPTAIGDVLTGGEDLVCDTHTSVRIFNSVG